MFNTKFQSCFLIAGCTVSMYFGSTLSINAQQIPPHNSGSFNGHACHSHPITDHPVGNGVFQGWRRMSIEKGPVDPEVKIVKEDWVVLVDHTALNSDCNDVEVEIKRERKVIHSISVGGHITRGGSVQVAADALFGKLSAEANARVEFNGNYTGTWDETISISSKTTVNLCKGKRYVLSKLKKEADGHISTYDHKFICRYTPLGGSTDVESYCNKAFLSGTAIGWGTTKDNWSRVNNPKDCPCGEDAKVEQEDALPIGGH